MRDILRKAFSTKEGSIIIVLIVLQLFSVLFVDKYTSASNFRLLLRAIPSLGIVSLGVCLLMIAGEFDLSVGSTFALGPMTGTLLLAKEVNIWVCFVVILLIGAAIGTVNGFLTVKTKIPSFIATLGAMMFWRGVVLVISDGRSGPFPLTEGFRMFFNSKVGPVSTQFIWLIVFAVIFWLILNRQKFGSWICSTGGNIRAAKAMGINTDSVKIIVFVITGVMASLGGLFDSTRIEVVHPLQGEGLALTAIAAVVIGGTSLRGGTGTILGTFLGASIVFTIQDILMLLRVQAYLFNAFVGLVIWEGEVDHECQKENSTY
jgi:simple sugar transport system permease protein